MVDWSVYGGKPEPKLVDLIMRTLRIYDLDLLYVKEDWAVLLDEFGPVLLHACKPCDLGARFNFLAEFPVCHKCQRPVPIEITNQVKLLTL